MCSVFLALAIREVDYYLYAEESQNRLCHVNAAVYHHIRHSREHKTYCCMCSMGLFVIELAHIQVFNVSCCH